jgi:hypothetical protein
VKLIVEVTEAQAFALRSFLNDAETGLRNQAGTKLVNAHTPEKYEYISNVVIALGSVSRAATDALEHKKAGGLKR